MKNIVLLFVVFVLCACDQSPDRILIDSKNLTTDTPADLRALERDNLSADITLNGNTTTHQGSEYPTGDWQIPINVEAGQTYDLSIQWRFNEFLLMEETGSFTVVEGIPDISPELDFTNAGLRDFDNDCDGQSNLVEIEQGSNPDIAETVDDGVCTGESNESIELTDSNRAFATSFHDSFGQSPNRIIERFEQPLQIRKSIASASDYSFTLLTEDFSETGNRATVRLRINDNGVKEAQAIFVPALTRTESSSAGSRCYPLNSEDSFSSGCEIPYDWEDNVWYSLLLTLTDGRWIASIKNLDDDTEVEIGSFTASPDLIWNTPQTGLGYGSRFTAKACREGLLPLRAHFGEAMVNSSIPSKLRHTGTDKSGAIGDCVGATGDWNFSVRTNLETPLFALEAGQSN